MSIYKSVFKLNKEEYKEQYEHAIKTYEKYRDIDPDNYNETDEKPMHPNLFYNLCSVHAFNRLNGYSYQEYIDKWKIRRKK